MKIEVAIGGMSCGHCVKAVTEALAALPDVADLHVDVGRARFTSASTLPEEALRAALDDAGYELVSVTAEP